MKILIIVPGGVDPSGKKAVIPALLNLYEQLSSSHEVVVLATRHHDELTEYALKGCDVISLPQMRGRQLLSMRKLALSRLNIKNFRPDIVHSFWLGATSFLGVMLSFYFKVPHLTSIGGGELVSYRQVPYGGCQTLKGRLLMWLNMKVSIHLTFGSQYVMDKSLLKIHQSSKLVPLGIDLKFWGIHETKEVRRKHWNILWLASINRVKNPWLMLDVADLLKRRGFAFHIHVIGVDTLDGSIQEQSEEKGLQSCIRFYGYREQKEVQTIMSDMDFILQTSHFESQGVAMAEAVSQGLCPVGTNVGWLNDMGFGIDSCSEQCANDFADEMVYLAKNFDERSRRVQKGQAWLLENDADNTSTQFERIYGQILSTRF